MRISWFEVLGLLIGATICYGVISYAITNAPQDRETTAEQTRESSRQGATEQRTTPVTSGGETKTVTIRVTGSTGEPFSGTFSTLDSSRSITGVAPTDYEVQARTDPSVADFVFAAVSKTAEDKNELKLQILDNGKVVKEGSTTEAYGVVSFAWSPSARGGETTSSTNR